ncbi:MAG: tetratricopeptide repeat protein, partial [Phycisphaerales bacterium]|nr:tetratricopeptide repeat protein [Phycisphaerales bacterium]
SDHGFHSDHLRPMVPAQTHEAQAALWHRHFGILLIKGPGIRRDERIYGATLLDIAPTLLTLLGLPVGQDMEGSPLLAAFECPPRVQSIPSWDACEGPAGMHPPDLRVDSAASAAAVQQLIDLGYLAPDPAGGTELAARAARETQFNLAAVHLHARRPGLAEPILRALHESHPQELRYAMALAHCLGELGQHREALRVLRGIENSAVGSHDLQSAIAQCELALDEREAALARLSRVEQTAPPSPHLYLVLGNLYRAQRLLEKAEAAYRRALALDEENEQAHYGLAVCLIPKARWQEVAEHALRAVSLVHGFPQAHYLLGAALDELQDTDRALTALRIAVSLAPNFPEAHDRIAAILLRRGDVAQAMRHQRMARGDFSSS